MKNVNLICITRITLYLMLDDCCFSAVFSGCLNSRSNHAFGEWGEGGGEGLGDKAQLVFLTVAGN